MSISLSDHENRISILENKSKSYTSAFILNNKTNLTTSSLLKYNFSQYVDYDFVYIAFDAWGSQYNYDYQVANEGLIPIGLLKQMWCQRTLMWGGSGPLESEGVKLFLSGNELQVKYVGTQGYGAIWKIIALKIYYIFRYNIYKILKLISPILKF